jgi:hypothetical protein
MLEVFIQFRVNEINIYETIKKSLFEATKNGYTRAIRNETTGELLTKEEMRKKCIIYKKYVHT